MRILLIRPCCIGDVIMATATLSALRSAYPDAHITWAVGGWSRRAIAYHPSIDRTDRRDLSIFRLGWDWSARRFTFNDPIPILLKPYFRLVSSC